MASDIVLNGESVEVFGNVGIGTGSPVRKLHVEGSEMHSSGAGGGLSFADRTRGYAERWVWYAQDGRSHLWSEKSARPVVSADKGGVAIDGNLRLTGNVGIGTANPAARLHVEGSEIYTAGAAGGYSFADRKRGDAERWVWHAEDGQAHLWSQKAGRAIVSTGIGTGTGTNTGAGGFAAAGQGWLSCQTIQATSKLVASGGVSIDGTVQLSGRFGIGTASPLRSLHVVGEIHSAGGASQTGLSFTDRTEFVDNPAHGERWKWHVVNSSARLWSGKDALEIARSGNAFAVRIHGELDSGVKELRGVAHPATTPGSSTVVRCRSTALAVEDPAAPLTAPVGPATQLLAGAGTRALPPPPPEPPGPMPDPVAPLPPRLALLHEFVRDQTDRLVINHQGRYTDGVRIEGNVQVTGVLTELSSAALKDNISALSGPEAMAALMGLNAVKYSYKADPARQRRIGFLAEDVPELVAHAQRDRISPMDIVAVLTRAVQELATEVARLTQNRPAP